MRDGPFFMSDTGTFLRHREQYMSTEGLKFDKDGPRLGDGDRCLSSAPSLFLVCLVLGGGRVVVVDVGLLEDFTPEPPPSLSRLGVSLGRLGGVLGGGLTLRGGLRLESSSRLCRGWVPS
jgi:hypothetical protein